MGMSYNEFYNMTPRAFNNKMSGWYAQRTEVEQMEWVRTRFIAYACLKPHSKGIDKPSDIMEFDWEKKEKKQVVVDPEYRAKILAKGRLKIDKNGKLIS